MVIYIFHTRWLDRFNLPKEIKGSYLLSDYDNSNIKRNLINIEARDNKWVAVSNVDVKISDPNSQTAASNDEVELKPYHFYTLSLNGVENVLIYVSPTYDNNFIFKSFQNDNYLCFGSNSQCEVIITSKIIPNKYFEIKKIHGLYSLNVLDEKNPVYVNYKREKQYLLNNCDVIFAMGVKIVVLGNKFLISYPKELGSIHSSFFSQLSVSYSVNNYDTTNKLYKDFYDEKDYFSKAPVFQNKYYSDSVRFADPPDISDKNSEKSSILTDSIPSILMGSTSVISTYFVVKNYSSGKTDTESLVTSVLMCVVMLVTGIIWPFINSFIQAIRHKIHFKKVKWKYTRYLKKKSKEIKEIYDKQRMFFLTNYLSIYECAEVLKNKTSYLYSRHISSNDFLTIRLGIGNRKFDCKYEYEKPEFSMEDTSLYTKIDSLIDEYRYLSNSPITFSLRENKMLFLINKTNSCKYEYMYAILLQLLILQGYDELKLVILTDKRGSAKFNIFKNVNHIWDDKKEMRFFVDDLNLSQVLFDYLDSILSKNLKNQKIDDYYLIVTDCINLYKSQPFINKILNAEKNVGFSIMAFDNDINNAPSICEYFVEYTEKDATLFNKNMDNQSLSKFVPEMLFNDKSAIDILDMAQKLSNIPLKINTSKSSNLVSHIGFLEMYGVGSVEQLNSDIKWRDDSIINSIATPIGVDGFGNLINLDLHEKRHGPHGLIAGMTGSGKSEFIITYILSLAVNYSPSEVQFVLIDYKGGGLAGAFENRKTGIKLPHLVGTITNLDKSEMNRTLVSIKSELQRRQRKFNEAKEKLNTGTIDIYKYQKLHREGKLDDTVSHLFIICDEFAELKAQQPDFMDQLVSTARIGRSLGVHLILATQKPSGVVDDQIWSNSKFKVCCKVQTTEDSNEMIRRPDAAFLTDAGRFYLQVGYDQYFILGQSAYAGAKYIPSNKATSTTDNSIEIINNYGDVLKIAEEYTEVDNSKVDYGEELTNILNYLIQIAKRENFSSNNLWLDNIPTSIYLPLVQAKYKNELKIEKNILNPIIGEYDDPENQSQGVVTLPLTKLGNTFICADTGGGKSTLLSTIIYSTIVSHSTNEVNIFIIDYGSENLKIFSKAPQVGEVITSETSDKVFILFNRIKKEIKNRKSKLAIKNLDYLTYISKYPSESMPNWLIIINGMDSFSESFNDFVMYDFPPILRECSKYGITIIISASQPIVVGYNTLNQIPQRIVLKLTNPESYMALLDTKLIPSQSPGRGLVKVHDNVYQFQTAQIFEESKLNESLDYVFQTLQNSIKLKAPSVPSLPEYIDYEMLSKNVSNIKKVPIGYDVDTVLPQYYNFDRYINFILGNSLSNISKFMNSLLKLLINSGNVRVIILDGNGKLNIKDKGSKNIKYYDSDFVKLLPFLKENAKKINPSNNQIMPIIVSGFEELDSTLLEAKGNDSTVMTLSELIMDCQDSKLFKFIIVTDDCYIDRWEKYDWFTLFNQKNGIYIGNESSAQDILIGKKRADEYKLQLDSTNAYVYIDGDKEIIKYVM